MGLKRYVVEMEVELHEEHALDVGHPTEKYTVEFTDHAPAYARYTSECDDEDNVSVSLLHVETIASHTRAS